MSGYLNASAFTQQIGASGETRRRSQRRGRISPPGTIATHQSPDREFRSALYAQLPKNLMEILLDRPFRQMEFVRDLLVQLRLDNQVDDLLFSKREMPRERLTFGEFRLSAGWADPILPVNGKFISAATTILKNGILCKFQVSYHEILLVL
jgi:hypothetical protein